MMEHIAHGCIVLDAGLGAFKVYEEWKEGKDWEYEMLQDAADIGMSVGIGFGTAAVFTLFCSGGWVVCLIAGVTAGALSLGVNDGLNAIGQSYLEPIIQKMRGAS